MPTTSGMEVSFGVWRQGLPLTTSNSSSSSGRVAATPICVWEEEALLAAQSWSEHHQQQSHPPLSQTREPGCRRHGPHLSPNPRGHRPQKCHGLQSPGMMVSCLGSSPWRAEARANKPTQRMGRKRRNLQKSIAYLQEPHKHLHGGLEPPDPVMAAGLLAATFESGVASACTAPGLPLPAPLNFVITVFSTAAFGSGITSTLAAAAMASFATAAIVASFVAAAAVASFAATTATASLVVVTIMASFAEAAFSASACTVANPPPPEPLDPIAVTTFFTVALGSGGGTVAFLVSAYFVVCPPLLEPRT
jgi:hypothetical protein